MTHTWPAPDPSEPAAIVRYELEPDGAGCRLTLTNEGVPAMVASAIMGWHVFLRFLPGATEGVRSVWTPELEEALRPRYAHLLPEGA